MLEGTSNDEADYRVTPMSSMDTFMAALRFYSWQG